MVIMDYLKILFQKFYDTLQKSQKIGITLAFNSHITLLHTAQLANQYAVSIQIPLPSSKNTAISPAGLKDVNLLFLDKLFPSQNQPTISHYQEIKICWI
jgi:hypothetical protein